MERKNQFDEAIKAKLGALEDEPSAQVWAGVRQDLGIIRPPVSFAWPLRMAAGVVLLAAAGLGFYLWQPSDTLPSGMALSGRSQVKRIVIVPLDRTGPGTFLAQDQDQDPAPQVRNARPRRVDQSFAVAPQPQITPQDTLKNFAPQPPMPEIEQRVAIEEKRNPKLEEIQVPKFDRNHEIGPDSHKEVRTQPVIASAHNKRSYKLPGREDLAPDNLRKKSGAILGAIANGANSFLGLDANYKEQNQDDTKLTAFNADFGLFKIKKVRTVKN